MPPFTVEGTTPVLIFGEGRQVAGEVWLTNPTAGSIDITSATLLVNFPTPETGDIALPSGAAIANGATRRLLINTSMQPFTPPGSYSATITLVTSAGNQAIPGTVVIAGSLVPELGPKEQTFTGVTAASTFAGSVVVYNRGNTPIVVGAIPDETLLEMVITPRVLEVVAGGGVTVAPALGMTPGGTVTFTNTKPTIPPGGWGTVDFNLTTPAVLAANLHFRVLPRIATERFVVNLLT